MDKQSKKILWLFVLIAAAAAFLAAWFWLGGHRQEKNSEINSQKSAVAEKTSSRLSQADIYAKTQLAGSKIQATTTPQEIKKLDISQVPDDVKPFVLDGAENLTVTEASFGGTTKGVDVKYILPKADIAATLVKLDSKPDGSWQRLNESRTDFSAILELQKVSQKIQILEKDNGQGGVSVEIKYIK